jgi:hypothetical protein
MNKDMLGKTLTLGVIILFISVGIQPALAIESKVSADDIEIKIDGENDGVCSYSFLRFLMLSGVVLFWVARSIF